MRAVRLFGPFLVIILASGLAAGVGDVWAGPEAGAGGSPYFDSLYDHPVPAGILDGAPKTLVVTGYSTSLVPDSENNWPAILQRMLDDHAGEAGTYFVYNEAVGGTPIAKWTDICGADNSLIEAVIAEYVNPGTHPDIVSGLAPPASVMLGQQSLQYVFDCEDRFQEIEVAFGEAPGPEDEARIQQGAEAIDYFAGQFLDGGIGRVYLATHIYAFFWKYALYGERFAMARALDLTPGLYPGPEVWEVSKSLFPGGFADDLRHPDIEVTHAMALYWYIVLAGEAAKQAVMEPIAAIAGVPIPGTGDEVPQLPYRIQLPLFLAR